MGPSCNAREKSRKKRVAMAKLANKYRLIDPIGERKEASERMEAET